MKNKLLNHKSIDELSKYFMKILTYGIFSFFIFVFLFSRSFVGISFFGFRVGELSMVFSMFTMLFFILLSLRKDKNESFMPRSLLYTNILLIFSFIILNFLNNGSFTSTYTFKSSSYIWSIGFLYLGILICKDMSVSKLLPLFVGFYLIYLYTYAVLDFPQGIMDFFLSISDKYEPHKGSDILIMTIVLLFFINRFFENRRYSLIYCLIASSLFLPLLLYKSRGAFIAFSIFFVIEIFRLRKSFKKPLLGNFAIIFVSVIIFLISSFIVTENEVQIDQVGSTVTELATYRIPDKEAEFIPIFISDGRIYSSDSNLNWRFQIWQDVIFDMNNQNFFLSGYGFNEKIPAMNDPLRAGDDGLNENIHNFLLNVFARGGIFHFTIYFFLILSIISFLKATYKNYSFMSIVFPILLASFFDASMENAHFPLIFYFFIGMISHKDNFFNNRV